jgi:hypothetical protein
VFKADNYLKLTVRTERTVRDYIKPFRSELEAEAVEALSDLLRDSVGSQELAVTRHVSRSRRSRRAVRRSGRDIPQIGEWHPDDLQAEPSLPFTDQPHPRKQHKHMNWSPNMNPGPQPVPNAAQPPAPQGPPQHQHTQGGPPVGGAIKVPVLARATAGSLAGAPPRINFRAPNLNDREPAVPFGDHVLRATGRVEFVGQKNDLLIVEYEVMQSNNAAAVGTKGCWKRKLTGTHVATDDMVSNAIGQMVVPLSGRNKQMCAPQEALN